MFFCFNQDLRVHQEHLEDSTEQSYRDVKLPTNFSFEISMNCHDLFAPKGLKDDTFYKKNTTTIHNLALLCIRVTSTCLASFIESLECPKSRV